MTAALEEYWAVEGSEVTLGSGLSCCLCDPADLERSCCTGQNSHGSGEKPGASTLGCCPWDEEDSISYRRTLMLAVHTTLSKIKAGFQKLQALVRIHLH